MKKLFFVLLALCMFCGCDSSQDIAEMEESFLLESPSGKELAPTKLALKKELRRIVGLEEANSSRLESIRITSVNYFEEEAYTIAIINLEVDGVKRSILKSMYMADEYIALSDAHKYRVVYKGQSNSEKRGRDVIELKNNTLDPTDMADCVGGECCGWTQTGVNEFNCGCDQATSIVLTTSDGCKIKI